MANLAIRGHATRGKEVIELLEMFWGMNKHQITAIRKTYVYFIDEDGIIRLLNIQQILPEQFIVFTLEEFFEKYPYKVEDKVYVNSIDYQGIGIVNSMYWDSENNIIRYEVFSDKCNGYWKVEELQPYKEETMEEINIVRIGFNSDKVKLILPDEYEFKTEGKEVYVVKKKSQYPKTYVECAKILNCFGAAHIDGYKCELLEKFQELLICRDAYWKIAGEEMGLGQPWKPNYDSGGQ